MSSLSTSWKKLVSSKYNAPYWFNAETGESRWVEPRELAAVAVAPQHAQSTPYTAIGAARLSRKRSRPNEEEEGKACVPPQSKHVPPATELATEPATTVSTEGSKAAKSQSIQTENCPEHLLWKRNYLFKGLNADQVEQLRMDEVSAFSITETRSAAKMTDLIWHGLQRATRGKKSIGDTCILDGMSCVGGNTISFATRFSRVLSNELDTTRFDMLKHNTRTVMKMENVEFLNRSVLEVGFERDDYDVIFLDPEWGGPDYKDSTNMVLPISGESMEDFCLNVLNRMPRVTVVALKLPLNYDNGFIETFSKNNYLTYEFYTEGLKKMSLTLLTKRGKS